MRHAEIVLSEVESGLADETGVRIEASFTVFDTIKDLKGLSLLKSLFINDIFRLGILSDIVDRVYCRVFWNWWLSSVCD